MSLLSLHHRRPNWLIGLLILTLLGPGFVPVQAHTRTVSAPDGQLHTLCTWQGDRHADSPEPWQSPAYAYAQLFGSAASGMPVVLATAESVQPVFHHSTTRPASCHQPRQPNDIRGPPASSC